MADQPDPTWFERQAARVAEDIKELPDWLRTNRGAADTGARPPQGMTEVGPGLYVADKSTSIFQRAQAGARPPQPEPIDLMDALHAILEQHGIASRSLRDGLDTLPSALVEWAANAMRQSQKIEAEPAESRLTQLRALPRYAVEGRYGGNIKWREHTAGDWIRADELDALLTAAPEEKAP